MISWGGPNASQQAVDRAALCSAHGTSMTRNTFSRDAAGRDGWVVCVPSFVSALRGARTANLYHVGTRTIINAEKF